MGVPPRRGSIDVERIRAYLLTLPHLEIDGIFPAPYIARIF
ncbi:MAG: hypothetical protein ACRD3K_08095 [Edaphobacter sp.]